MTLHRRDFAMIALAAAFVTPTLAQTIRSESGAVSGTGQTSPIWDFSGVWAKPYLGIEPPPSGPGPVTNLARRNGARDVSRYVGDYMNPILKPHAAEIVRKYGEISLAGVVYPSPRNQCWPQGVPGVFFDVGMQMLQTPDRISIIYNADHEVRRVRLNDIHPTLLTPSWYGDSIGHYEGDALVVDTVGVKAGPFAMMDFYGTPWTDHLHVVERYRLVDDEVVKEGQERGLKENPFLPGGGDSGLAMDDGYKGKGLQLQFMVEDEGVFTMPWSATVTYRRAVAWPESVCAENLNATWITKENAVPRSERPDF
jgi:hypothetical protein